MNRVVFSTLLTTAASAPAKLTVAVMSLRASAAMLLTKLTEVDQVRPRKVRKNLFQPQLKLVFQFRQSFAVRVQPEHQNLFKRCPREQGA